MDKQIRRLKKLVSTHLYQEKEDIKKIWGKPLRHSDTEIWFYYRYRWGIFRDEITFIFQDHKVVDIAIIEYFLWIESRYIFFHEHETPEYKVFKVL